MFCTLFRITPAKWARNRACAWDPASVDRSSPRLRQVSTPITPTTVSGQRHAVSTIGPPPSEWPISTTYLKPSFSTTAATSRPKTRIVQDARSRPDAPCPAKSRATTAWRGANAWTWPSQPPMHEDERGRSAPVDLIMDRNPVGRDSDPIVGRLCSSFWRRPDDEALLNSRRQACPASSCRSRWRRGARAAGSRARRKGG